MPDSPSFNNLLNDEFPSLKQLYSDYEAEWNIGGKEKTVGHNNGILYLLMQTFNMCGHNMYNKQLCISLFTRLSNERGEFSRIIDRTVLIFSESENDIYNLLKQTLKSFVVTAEKLDEQVDGEIWNPNSNFHENSNNPSSEQDVQSQI